uniref:Uncharacterized protein n=1 Tax=Eutreptiella gymnastica TaxID=73025 RepID=A0A7S4LB60_9EUGL
MGNPHWPRGILIGLEDKLSLAPPISTALKGTGRPKRPDRALFRVVACCWGLFLPSLNGGREEEDRGGGGGSAARLLRFTARGRLVYAYGGAPCAVPALCGK